MDFSCLRKADRLIFSQDGEQYNKGDWAFSIPDAFGRIVLTGICKKVKIGNNAESLIAIGCLDNTVVKASWANATNTLKGYATSGATPITPTVYTANYYDGYTFLGKNSIPDNIDTRYNAESGYGVQYTQSAKGLLTGTLTAQQLSNGTVSSTYLYSIMYYDIRGQVVQTKSNNHLSGGIEKGYMSYNFIGQPILQKTIHSAIGKITQTEVYGYSYDHAGRLKETWHRLNDNSSERLADNRYDRLGKLELHRKGHIGHGITYTYNIRSWIKSISSPLFKQTLYYNESLTMPNSTPSYTGNISAVEWAKGTEKTRRYNYFYDGLSQLLEAYYFNEEFYENYDYVDYSTYYDYDLNGNVTLMSRWGPASDYLTMEYKGNQLIKADDGDPDVPLATSADFKDYSNAAIEYAYNKNGAMTKDLNKGISDIQYNSLNLPRQMDIKSPVAEARNEYTYSAGGKKLKVVQKWNPNFSTAPIIGSGINVGSLSMTKTTDYVGNKVYENGSLKRILIDGGYIEGNTYYFYLTDHLGNNRVVINQSGQVIQKNDYYPFGMAFAEGTTTEQGKQPYKFGNKELDQMHGLNQYDIEARYYDPPTGRFTTIDPMAEKYYSISPYVYCANNPLRFIDPTGMVIDSASVADWERQRNTILDRMADLNLVENGGFQKNKDRIISLLKTLGDMKTLENSTDIYSLSAVNGYAGELRYDISTGKIIIEYTNTSNFVHEVTHGVQYERGEIGFHTQTGNSVAQDLWDEVGAYRAQYSYDPSSISTVSKVGDITAKWVQGITDSNGNKPYAPGGDSNMGLYPLNGNSRAHDIMTAYPSLRNEIIPVLLNLPPMRNYPNHKFK